MTTTTRREALGIIGLATGSALFGAFKSAGQGRNAPKPDGDGGGAKLAKCPWPYVKLDPQRCAERSYSGFLKGHCLYGTFQAIVEEFAEKQGAEYANFPFDMLQIGAGGGNGWGTLCGALNGGMMALALFSKTPGPLVDELFNWYQVTPLPIFRPKNPRMEIKVRSVSDSLLCHLSVTKWCNAAGVKAFSPERDERCGWLVADTTLKTVELLNAQLDGTFKAAHPMPAATATCMSCHEKGGVLENSRGKMDCGLCHFTSASGQKHPDIQ